MADILVIDDDRLVAETLEEMVRALGHDAVLAHNLKEGLGTATAREFDVVLLDVRLPDGNGLDAIPDFLNVPSSPEVLIVTGFGDPDGAELAIKSGAWDYIEKPPNMRDLNLQLTRALQYRDEKKRAEKALATLDRGGIVGNSTKLRACLDLMAQAAGSDTNVLITGETGTGKELFAKAIHKNSERTRGPFVVVDCAALPDKLVESMLFGHERGAFTGADAAQKGLIGHAHTGTLFLDEVGELPVNIQKAFLRVLQERSFRPIGGKREIKSDFRLVVATNRDLTKMCREGQFREELLYRLMTVTIDLPPLRRRPEDIFELVFFYAGKICRRLGTEPKGFSPEFFEALSAYSWPGNVRELINTLEGAITKSHGEPILFSKHLPLNIRVHLARLSAAAIDEVAPAPAAEPAPENGDDFPRLKDVVDYAAARAESQYLKDLMAYTGGDLKEAIRVSGLSRSRLYARLKKHDIPRKG